MKSIINIIRKIDTYMANTLEKYIYKVSKTLYPKPHLEDDDDDEPILFI